MKDKRNHKPFSFLIALLILCLMIGPCAPCVFAESADGYTYIADSAKKTAQITGYTGKSLTLTLPSKIAGLTVTSVKAEAFKGKDTILSVTIPDTITTLGNECFAGCTLLGTFTLGSSVSTIGSKAFSGCAVLTTITIPPTVSSIGAQAFSGCKMMTKITVDNGNLSYMSKDDALFNKAGTTLIRYPAARSGKSYKVPDSVTTIESYAFEGAKFVTEIDTGSSVSTIREGAFKDCIALEKITISPKVTKLSDELFSGCKKLSSLNIPTKITSIGASAFKGCTSISAVTIPDSVTAVGADAFSGCTGMRTVTVDKNLSVVSGVAFRGCSALSEFKLADGADFSVQDGALFSKDGTRLIVYPAGKTNSSYTVGDKVTTIGVYAFDSCSHLKKLIVPATVKTLAKPVIANCGNTVIYVDDGSAAMKYFKAETDGYSALKIGGEDTTDEPDTKSSDGTGKPGDVNGDSKIDNADVILLRRYVAKWKNVSIDKNVSDVNKDGALDNADVILIRRYVAGWKNVTLK